MAERFWKTVKRFKLVLGIAALIVGLLTALGLVHPSAVSGAPESNARTFTVVVRDSATGRPVARAKVVIAPNALTPATKIADSEGVVTARLPASTQSAHITVEAPGFEVYEREVALWTAAFEDVRLTAAPKKGRKAPVGDKPPTPALGSAVASAPNGIVITGGVVTNPHVQNVYNSPGPIPTYKWQLSVDPKVFVTSVEDPALGRRHDENYVEGVLTIIPDGDLVHPIVVITCSCRSVSTLGNSTTAESVIGDKYYFKFKEPSVFYAGQPVAFKIQAHSVNTAQVSGVTLGNYP